MIKEIVLVGAGGFAGSVLRYLTSLLVLKMHWNSPLPLATLSVNVIGSLLIGLFLVTTSETKWFFFCVAGFCGGFTTFSAFSSEALTLIRSGEYAYAGLYIAASVIVCIAAVGAGLMLGSKLLNR